MNDKELIQQALKARKNAYAPYSKFAVGAALLTKNGKIYLGCNIESASFSPTCCAERVAFFNAVSNSEREFSAIAVVGGNIADKKLNPCSPCGVCRQVMSEFCSPDFKIILSDGEENIKVYNLGELLPLSFSI